MIVSITLCHCLHWVVHGLSTAPRTEGKKLVQLLSCAKTRCGDRVPPALAKINCDLGLRQLRQASLEMYLPSCRPLVLKSLFIPDCVNWSWSRCSRSAYARAYYRMQYKFQAFFLILVSAGNRIWRAVASRSRSFPPAQAEINQNFDSFTSRLPELVIECGKRRLRHAYLAPHRRIVSRDPYFPVNIFAGWEGRDQDWLLWSSLPTVTCCECGIP